MSTQTGFRTLSPIYQWRVGDALSRTTLLACYAALALAVSGWFVDVPTPLGSVVFVAALVLIGLWAIREARMMRRHTRMWQQFSIELDECGGYTNMDPEQWDQWQRRIEAATEQLRGRGWRG